tara:strand:- start:1258 stop:2943 length:1686 start_codon:yes stop_codon:yes gene_type:complete
MLKLYFSLFLSFLLLACSSSDSEMQLIAKGGPIYGGSVSYYASEKSDQIFPMSVVSMYDQRAVAPVYETLLSYDEENQRILSNLIEAYSFSADNAYLDLKIRQGISFHDDPCFANQDRNLVASDVKFTLDFACSRHELNAQGQLLTPKIIGAEEFLNDSTINFNSGVKGIQVLSDSTLRLSLIDSTQTILKILTHQSLSVISKKAYTAYGKDIANHPIGTGPFVFKQKSGEGILYEKNQNYWRADNFGNKLPFIDTLKIKFKKEGEDIFDSFTSQKTDLLSAIPVSEINSLFGTLTDAQEGKNILHKVKHKKGLKINFLEFDCNSLPFKDSNLRKAIYHAVDRQEICREFLFGEGSPAELGILPSVPFFKYTRSIKNPYNMSLAKSYLRKSNFTKSDTITFYVSTKEGSPEDDWCLSLVEKLIHELKLNVNLKRVSFNEKMLAIQSGAASMWLAGFISDYPDAESFLMPYYSKNKGKASNKNGYFMSLEFDRTMDAARAEMEPVKRNEYFNSCVEILNEKAPIVPLYFEDLVVVFNLRLRGARVNSFGILDLSEAYLKSIK